MSSAAFELIEKYKLWVSYHRIPPHWHVVASDDSRTLARHDELIHAINQCVHLILTLPVKEAKR